MHAAKRPHEPLPWAASWPSVLKVIRYPLSRGFASGAVRAAVEAAADEDGYGEELDEFGGSSEFS